MHFHQSQFFFLYRPPPMNHSLRIFPSFSPKIISLDSARRFNRNQHNPPPPSSLRNNRQSQKSRAENIENLIAKSRNWGFVKLPNCLRWWIHPTGIVNPNPNESQQTPIPVLNSLLHRFIPSLTPQAKYSKLEKIGEGRRGYPTSGTR